MGTVETTFDTMDRRRVDQITGETMLLATLVAIAVAGPLMVLMVISFCTTLTLFLVSAPLFIIFGPLLLGAGFVLTMVLVGFGMAAMMAMAGLATLGWVFRSLRGDTGKVIRDMVVELGDRVKDAKSNWAIHLNQKVHNMPENWSVVGA